MHRVLERQLKRYFGEQPIPAEWTKLLQVVSDTYTSADEDRALLDRSLELSSKEFSDTNRELRNAKEKIEETVLERTRELEHALSDVQVQKNKVEESKAKDEAILLSVGDGLIATDREGKIILANSVSERLLGWSKQEMIGKTMAEIVPHENEAGGRTPLEERALTHVLHGRTPLTVTKDFYYVRKDGTRFPAAGTTTPILLSGTIVGAVVVFRDITQEKELDRAKSDFISLASHQLRTPLSSMKWVLELLVQDTRNFDAKQREKLNDLRVSSERLIQLVNSLLNIARMETGKLVATKKPARINDLIQVSCKLIKPSADKKKQTINVQLKTEITDSLIDPMLFDETFNNLLANAINYGPEGAVIDVTVSAENGMYQVSVHNPGPTIPPEDKEKMFTKFYRSQEARTLVSAGTGLGLYIAKAAAEANGGTIGYDSVPERGTTFFFTVPAM